MPYCTIALRTLYLSLLGQLMPGAHLRWELHPPTPKFFVIDALQDRKLAANEN